MGLKGSKFLRRVGTCPEAATIVLMLELDERVIVPDAPQYNAALVARTDETESLGYFTVKFDGEATPFEPGQYMTIGVFIDGKIVHWQVTLRVGFTLED